MLDTLDGIPVHPLVVHVVVVVAPLTALLAVVYALAPTRRSGLRWPLVAAALVTGTGGLVAGQSGEKLLHRLFEGMTPDATLQAHTEDGDLLQVLCVAFMVLVLAAVLLLLRPHRPGAAPARGPLALLATVLLVAASVALVWVTVETGHTGAKAVWGNEMSDG